MTDEDVCAATETGNPQTSEITVMLSDHTAADPPVPLPETPPNPDTGVHKKGPSVVSKP